MTVYIYKKLVFACHPNGLYFYWPEKPPEQCLYHSWMTLMDISLNQ